MKQSKLSLLVSVATLLCAAGGVRAQNAMSVNTTDGKSKQTLLKDFKKIKFSEDLKTMNVQTVSGETTSVPLASFRSISFVDDASVETGIRDAAQASGVVFSVNGGCIVVQSATGINSLTVVDLQGRQLAKATGQANATSLFVDLSTQPVGVAVVVVTTPASTVTRKIWIK